MFRNISELVSDSQSLLHTTFRKLPVAAPAAGTWFDLSMTSGYPVPNHYASNPLESRYMSYSRQKGIFHGHGNYKDKRLFESMVMGTVTQWQNTPMIMLDYLMYYPFVDEGDSEVQLMGNIESLPRYTDGRGVQMMAVSLGSRLGGRTLKITYTNQDGVSDRVTPLIMGNNTSTVNGSLMNTTGTLTIQGSSPFLPLQGGDTGVRSVQSVQMISGVDTGIFALVLVRPLAVMGFYDASTVSYKNHVTDSGLVPPKIENDAYVNFLIMSNGSFSGQTLSGYLNFIAK